MRPSDQIVSGTLCGYELEPGVMHGYQLEPGTMHVPNVRDESTDTSNTSAPIDRGSSGPIDPPMTNDRNG